MAGFGNGPDTHKRRAVSPACDAASKISKVTHATEQGSETPSWWSDPYIPLDADEEETWSHDFDTPYMSGTSDDGLGASGASKHDRGQPDSFAHNESPLPSITENITMKDSQTFHGAHSSRYPPLSVPQRNFQSSETASRQSDASASSSWCASILPGLSHPNLARFPTTKPGNRSSCPTLHTDNDHLVQLPKRGDYASDSSDARSPSVTSEEAMEDMKQLFAQPITQDEIETVQLGFSRRYEISSEMQRDLINTHRRIDKLRQDQRRTIDKVQNKNMNLKEQILQLKLTLREMEKQLQEEKQKREFWEEKWRKEHRYKRHFG